MKQSKTILVIDDDEAFLESMQMLLMEKNYFVITCSSSEQALLIIQDHPPAVIITDLAMPSLRGEDLLHVLHERYSHIPVIICTALPNVDPLPLLADGAINIFQKPFSCEALLRTLEKAA